MQNTMSAFRRIWMVLAIGLFAASAHAATAPLNDLFSSAEGISGNSGRVAGTNVGASKEAGEPNHGGNTGGKSVWFRWVAPNSGTARFSTAGSNFDTLLSIYTGSSVNDLNVVASGDDVSSTDKTSRATFNAISGTAYYIAVDGFNDNGRVAEGAIALSWTLPPANDSFANAQVLSSTSGRVTGSFASATAEAGEPEPLRRGHSLWYRFTSEARGYATFDLSGSSNSVLAVYTGDALGTLVEVARDVYGYYGGAGYNAAFTTKANTIYYIAVDSSTEENFGFTYSFIADAIAPVVSFTTPTNGMIVSNLRSIRGDVSENANGSGLSRVELFIQRRSDRKFWNGSSWVSTRVALSTRIDANGWARTSGNPSGTNLTGGAYTLQVVAFDRAENKSNAPIINITVDSVVPTILTFTTPVNGATISSLPLIQGTVMDNAGGTGIRLVELFIQRLSDRKYWTGTTWSSTSTILTTTISGSNWKRSSGLPSGANLTAASYNLTARAYDRAGNRLVRASKFTVARPTATMAASEMSKPTLSSATADVAQSTLRLVFMRAVDAQNIDWQVEINGATVAVESVQNVGNTVVLGLPEGALKSGDVVTVQSTLTGTIGPILAP